MDDIAKGLPGHLHLLGGILLVKTFQVGQPDGFQLVESQNDLFEISHRDAARLEIGYARLMRHKTAFKWSGHTLLLAYANNNVNPSSRRASWPTASAPGYLPSHPRRAVCASIAHLFSKKPPSSRGISANPRWA